VVAPANPRIVIAKLSPSACDQSSGTISPSSWKLVNATLKEAGLTLNRVMPVNCWLSLSTSGAGSADAAVAQLQKAPAAAAGECESRLAVNDLSWNSRQAGRVHFGTGGT
jgi:hypothetical protein